MDHAYRLALIVGLACMSLGWGVAVFADPPAPVADGVTWLEANQNTVGSWGEEFQVTVTSSILEALATLDPCRQAVASGSDWLAGEEAANNDYLARATSGLAGVPAYQDTAESLTWELLSRKNPPETNASLPNWPEGGWGLAEDFETDCLTTALAMLALDRTGFNGGFAVIDEPLAGGGTNVHPWEIPADATKVRLLVTVSGSQVRLCMTEGAPPSFCNPYFPLPPGGPYQIVFPDSGLPFTSGANFVIVESPNPPALPASYTMTASYETPVFDTRSLAEPLDYLREAQNTDGGWGLQRGLETDFYTTLHVLLALLGYSSHGLTTEIDQGIAFVKSQQLSDGSFGFAGQSVPYVSALAALNLTRHEAPTFSQETEDTIAALLATQELDGSWGQSSYDTGLANLSLWEHELPPRANGGVDQTVDDVDENCIETVALSGSGSDSNGTIMTYGWSEDCVEIAMGASPLVTLGLGNHRLLLTVTDDDGYEAHDSVVVAIEGEVDEGCADSDADGILDDGDGSGTAGDNPCADGVRQACDDNCFLVANPDQAESDGDQIGDACDCDSGSGTVWASPSEARDLRLDHEHATGVTTVSWVPPSEPGAVAVVYDTIRSSSADDFVTGATCVEWDDGADIEATDSETPDAGSTFCYLVRAENGCPAGEGSLGTSWDGVARVARVCP